MYLDFLWSKGIFNRTEYMLSDNIIKPSEEYISKQIFSNNNIIWIRNNIKRYKIKDLDYFVDNIHHINRNIILITGDSDLNVPSCYSYKSVSIILNNKYIKKWYTQNYDRTIIHEKLSYYPIGLDLHTKRWLVNNDPIKKIEYMIKIRFMNLDRINNKIFCDSHLRITNKERKLMYDQIKHNIRIAFLEKIYGFNKITINYRKYKFVISPVGNGLDCHRTWELFLLGCIVITKTSSLDQMWIENKLPVVIINDWNDLNSNLKTKIKLWIGKYDKYTNFDYIFSKFKNSYWVNNFQLNNISIEEKNNRNLSSRNSSNGNLSSRNSSDGNLSSRNSSSGNLSSENLNSKNCKFKFINSLLFESNHNEKEIMNESESFVNVSKNFDLDNEYLLIDSHIEKDKIDNYINEIRTYQ